jgi:hypothetical protein
VLTQETTMKFSQLTIKTPLPAWRPSMPVFALPEPPLAARRAAARKLADVLRLGHLRTVEFEHGQVLAGERGDVTVFHASGAVLARDATAAAEAKDEWRDWPGLAPATAGADIAFTPDAAKRLGTMVTELLRSTDLLGREAGPATVQLEQVAQLDARGKEVRRGVGQAVVKYAYAVEGVAARGAGAKTVVFAEPGGASGALARHAGIFHAWRPLGAAVPVKLPTLEAALAVGLLPDPELDRYAAAGHRVEITRLELVYLALPAFMRQGQLFPALQVEGEVAKGPLGDGFAFARFHHAAPPAAYAEAGLHGPYLSLNPDGIVPRAGKDELR